MSLARKLDRSIRVTLQSSAVGDSLGVGVVELPAVQVNPFRPLDNPADPPPENRVVCSITKTLGLDPGRATIDIINLSQRTREAIAGRMKSTLDLASASVVVAGQVIKGSDLGLTTYEQVSTSKGLAFVRVEAGHGGTGAVMFEGSSGPLRQFQQGTDWVTSIEAVDGEIALSTAAINQRYGRGTFIAQVLRDAVAFMGLGEGTPLDPGNPLLPTRVRGFRTGESFVSRGRARDTVAALAAALQFDFWVDNGLFFAVDRGAALRDLPVAVTGDESVSGIPLYDKPHRLDGGGLQIRTDAVAPIRVGRQVVVSATQFDGRYRCESVQRTIDNRGGPFDAVAQLRSIDGVQI